MLHELAVSSLEFNVQQAILSDLAANAAKFATDTDVIPILDAVASNVQTIDASAERSPEDAESRVYMVRHGRP
jgi:hypothetical protein